ncbi:MAG: circadian clock KaiB family protein [Bacteroidetes bacterium]|nr:circadian clock KaiB family protein [Bacteroidota bacterium]MBU1579222.1 circadian clock KaiB family protein [Bacteroidota bacterium]
MKEKKIKVKSSLDDLDLRVSNQGKDKYILRLYITGSTNRSVSALTNLKMICKEYLEGRYELEVIDLYQHPSLAKGEQIIAAPTLIKKLPLPFRRIIGDMSDKEKVLLGLDLKEVKGKNDFQ